MKFSVIVPVYNAEKYLKKCIMSVIDQSYDNWELLLVDDGSGDGSPQIIDKFSEKDKRIIAVHQDNCGPGIARNNGINKACGDYIVFLDSDDYIESDYLISVKKAINKYEYDVIVLDNYYEKADGTIIREEILSKFKSLSKEQLIAVQMTGKMPWGGCRKVIKRTLIADNAIEYSADKVGEEALFSFRVFYGAQKIGFLCKKVYHYVDYPTSQSKKGDDDPWGIIVDKVSVYINNEIGGNSYTREINSFAYTALAVSLFRISVNHGFFVAIKLGHNKISEVYKKYKCDCNNYVLERRVKLMLPFIRLRFISPLIIASKIKQLIRTNKQ